MEVGTEERSINDSRETVSRLCSGVILCLFLTHLNFLHLCQIILPRAESSQVFGLVCTAWISFVCSFYPIWLLFSFVYAIFPFFCCVLSFYFCCLFGVFTAKDPPALIFFSSTEHPPPIGIARILLFFRTVTRAVAGLS